MSSRSALVRQVLVAAAAGGSGVGGSGEVVFFVLPVEELPAMYFFPQRGNDRLVHLVREGGHWLLRDPNPPFRIDRYLNAWHLLGGDGDRLRQPDQRRQTYVLANGKKFHVRTYSGRSKDGFFGIHERCWNPHDYFVLAWGQALLET